MFYTNLMKKGPIIELLEPAARSFVNIPQDASPSKRINCLSNNDGAFKAHALVMQGSRNFFQWRVKRSSKVGNCTLRISADGDNFAPIIPVGKKSFKFPCGRSSGYESAEYVLPKSAVNNEGAIL